MPDEALQTAFEIKTTCDEISRKLLRWHWENKPGEHSLGALLDHIRTRQQESPEYYDRLPDLAGRNSWQQLDTTLCMRVLLDSEKDAAHQLDLLGNTEHPAAARRAGRGHAATGCRGGGGGVPRGFRLWDARRHPALAAPRSRAYRRSLLGHWVPRAWAQRGRSPSPTFCRRPAPAAGTAPPFARAALCRDPFARPLQSCAGIVGWVYGIERMDVRTTFCRFYTVQDKIDQKLPLAITNAVL